MPKVLAIQINWQFMGGIGIMQVEHTADCFGGAWFKSPLSTEVWHPRHIWWETAFQFAEKLAVNGETYVVSVNEFSATCNWQVVGVQVEQNQCKDRALRKAVTLGSPSTGVMPCAPRKIDLEAADPPVWWTNMACFYSVCKEDQCARQCHMLLLSPQVVTNYNIWTELRFLNRTKFIPNWIRGFF